MGSLEKDGFMAIVIPFAAPVSSMLMGCEQFFKEIVFPPGRVSRCPLCEERPTSFSFRRVSGCTFAHNEIDLFHPAGFRTLKE